MSQNNGELAFSRKYDNGHSRAYFEKHRRGLRRRLSHAREVTLARQALAAAGHPDSILDLPCGTGRFWPTLIQSGASRLIGADFSEPMLSIAAALQPPGIASAFELIRTSAFDIPLKDDAVDCIFCMRLLHHVGDAHDRKRMLAEFHRVAKQSVCLSLWVDGNYQAGRRRRLEAKRSRRAYQNRFIVPAEIIEAEFRDTGFDIITRLDFLRRISMWRVYVLSR